MAETGENKVALDLRDPVTGNLLHIRGSDPLEFQAFYAEVSQFESLAAFFGSPATPADGAVATSPAEVASPGANESGPRGFNEPCEVCSKPKVKIIMPKAGQKWAPFAGCDVWDDIHKAAAGK